MLLILAFVVCVVIGFVLAASADAGGFQELAGVGVCLFCGIGAVIVGAMYVNARFYPRIEIAQIEAVRSAVRECPRDRSHAIYLEAVQKNETIRESQAWRRLWWARDFTNAGWDSIQVIAFPADSVGAE
jgi:hypothetical protein